MEAPAVKIKSFPTNKVPSGALAGFAAECGPDYRVSIPHHHLEKDGRWTFRLIFLHKDARLFIDRNSRLGHVYAFSQEEADHKFALLEKEFDRRKELKIREDYFRPQKLLII